MGKETKLHALEISLTIGCKLACKYCPQKLLLSNYFREDKERESKLKFEDFKVALEKVQPNASISFCGMSEPFHNEECADMIVYAYEKGYKISLLTTLVGMRDQDFEKIKNIEFDSFVLHIPDEQMNSKFIIDNEYIEMLKKVNSSIQIDYYSCHGSVHKKIEDIIDKTKYAGIALGDRAGNLDLEQVEPNSPKEGRIVCYHGSEKQIGGWAPVMLPDGTLVLCCMDYGMKHVLGNLITQSWEEIKNGEPYQYFVEGLKDDSKDILCRRCSDSRKVEHLPAMIIGNYIKEHKENGKADASIWSRMAKAENVCVFGIGKLFRDHFYQEYWHEGLNIKWFVDNNTELQGQYINNILCVSPTELANMEKVMVIIFVKNAEQIKKQLFALGINEVITIDELLEEYNRLGKANSKQLSLKVD